MTEQEKTNVLATRLMGWELKKCVCTGDMLWTSGWTQELEDEYGDICKIPFFKGFNIHDKTNFYEDWNHARQVIEKVMEDDELFNRLVCTFDKCNSCSFNDGAKHYMKATLPERMDAVLAVLPKND